MNRVYTITFTKGPDVALVTSTARTMADRGVAVQDQGGQSVSFRVTGATSGDRDRSAIMAVRTVMTGTGVTWELATGMGVHRRVVTTGGRA